MQQSWTTVTSAQQRALRWALWVTDLLFRHATKTMVVYEYGVQITPGTAFLTNHRSWWDSFFWGWIVFRRFVERQPELMPLNVYKRKWYARVWPVTQLLRLWRSVPVQVNGGINIGAYKSVVETLRAGAVVHLFPEGSRSKKDAMLPIRKSPCAAILEAGASIQIAYCLARGKMRFVIIGQKISPEALRSLVGSGTINEQARVLQATLNDEFQLLRARALSEYERRRQ